MQRRTSKLTWFVAALLSCVCAWQQAAAVPMPPNLTFVCIYSRIEDGSVECYDTLFAVSMFADCNVARTPITVDDGGPGTMAVMFDGVGETILFSYSTRSWQSDTPSTGNVTLNVFSTPDFQDTSFRCPTYVRH